MASVLVQPVPAVQNALDNILPEQPSTPLAVPGDASQRGGPPQDTVTISSAQPGGQQPEDTANQPKASRTPKVEPAPKAVAASGAAAAAERAAALDPPGSAGAQAALRAGTSPKTTAVPARGASSTPAQTASSTQQQELAQLDQILQALGVAPQSISSFNQLAMLRYLDDPTALRQFVQRLRGAGPLESSSRSQTVDVNA